MPFALPARLRGAGSSGFHDSRRYLRLPFSGSLLRSPLAGSNRRRLVAVLLVAVEDDRADPDDLIVALPDRLLDPLFDDTIT